LANKIEFKIFGDAKDLEKSLANTGKAFQRFGKSMTTFVTLPILAAGAGFVKLASDAEETANKFNVVFGSMRREANAWAESFGDSVGRSTDQMQQFSSSLGDVLKPLGFTTEEAFKLSASMTELALDVASFNNRQDADVVRAFTSALTGERESLKTLGIVIQEADVKQEAYASGIAKTGAQLTKTQKAQATVNLLYKNTADAQGDLLRTQDSFANQLKRLNAEFRELGISLGVILLPAATDLVKSLTNLTTNFNSLNVGVQTSILQFAGVLAVIGPVVLLLGVMASGLGAIATFAAFASAKVIIVGEAIFLLSTALTAVAAVGAVAFIGWKIVETTKEIFAMIDAVNLLNSYMSEADATQAESLRARGLTTQDVTAFAATKAAEARQQEIDAINGHNEEKQEIEEESQSQEIASITAFREELKELSDLNFINMQNILNKEIQLTKSAEEQKTDIIENELKARESLREADKKSQVAVIKFAQQMTEAFGKESKAAFFILKALRIAEILVNSFAAAMNIQAVWAWNPPVAAALLAQNRFITGLSIAGVVGTAIAGFANGAATIPRDMTANIHRGETIIPATFAESIRTGELSLSGGGGGGAGTTYDFTNAQFNGINEDMVVEIFDKASEMTKNRTLISGVA